jgi:7-cyano-7-deazaguanine synthase
MGRDDTRWRRGGVVLLSGGLDSCVTAALAAAEGPIAALHADYGQRTAVRERQAFEAICDRLGVPDELRRVLDLDFLRDLKGSALTDSALPVPEGEPGPGIPSTYVPFRNAHLLAAAASWAEILDAGSVWIGAVAEDSSGYPDCTGAFLEAFERAARLGTVHGGLEIRAPLLHARKGRIVRMGIEAGAPLELTWSCYQGSDVACGVCESCRLRLRGFADAGMEDPIPYARREAR